VREIASDRAVKTPDVELPPPNRYAIT